MASGLAYAMTFSLLFGNFAVIAHADNNEMAQAAESNENDTVSADHSVPDH